MGRFIFTTARHEVATLSLGLVIFCFFAFIYDLGGSALFEPTEGRNAEIAREILYSHDWVTPHDDFVPVLDKPIFFHWSIALATNFSVFPNGRRGCRRLSPGWGRSF